MLRDLFNNTPAVTKNLFLLCLLVFIIQITGETTFDGEGVTRQIGLYYIFSHLFEPYQVVSHMFAHGSVAHLLFNMLALISIGSLLERVWGAKRFLIFYLVCGFGAMIIHELAMGYDLYKVIGEFKAQGVYSDGSINPQLFTYTESERLKISEMYSVPTLGASGAVYGLLIGLAMLFPNIELMLFLIPVPIKAKYLVPVLMVVELLLGMRNYEMDNVAHFAHLGGALFGFIMIKIWSRNRKNFY